MIKQISRILVVISFVAFSLRCDNYEFPESPYPRIETLPVVDISEAGVTFQANIIQLGDKEVTNHGFVWGTEENLSIDSEDKVQLGVAATAGKFEARVMSGLYEDQSYFVKAFVATEDYFVYGKAVAFTSKGSTSPIIESFSPAEGTWGDTITIKGNYFSALPKNNNLKFGSFTSNVVTSNDSLITCIVPNDIPTKTVPIYLTVAGNQTHSNTNFVLITPTIESFSPTLGTFDDIVTITGSHFSGTQSKNFVKFNEFDALVTESSPTQIKVKVPRGINAKDNVVAVTVNLQTVEADGAFEIIPPTVSSISTDKEFIGSVIEIEGNNFNPAVMGNIVRLAGLQGTIIDATKSSITIQIPQGIYKSRSFPLEVVVAGQSAFSQQTFTLQDPWIRKADVPHGQFGRYDCVAFSIDGMGYIGMGSSGGGNAFWRFDPAENSWTEVAPFPGTERGGAVAFVVAGKAYVGLGSSVGNGTTPANDFWRFDPQANTWTRLADFPYEAYHGVGVTVNEKGYVVMPRETENFWQYDEAADSWIAMPDYPGVHLPYDYPDTGFEIGGNIYIYSNDNSTGPNPFYEFDLTDNVWTSKASLDDPAFSYGETGYSTRGFGYVRGAYYLFKYDPSTDTWHNEGSEAPGNGSYGLTFKIGDIVYVGAGQGRYDFWEFNPDYE